MKTQPITPENIIETLVHNDFHYNDGNELFYNNEKTCQFYYDGDTYQFMIIQHPKGNASIQHKDLDKVLKFMSEFINLKPLPHSHDLMDWWADHRVKDFILQKANNNSYFLNYFNGCTSSHEVTINNAPLEVQIVQLKEAVNKKLNEIISDIEKNYQEIIKDIASRAIK